MIGTLKNVRLSCNFLKWSEEGLLKFFFGHICFFTHFNPVLIPRHFQISVLKLLHTNKGIKK